jgi:hypothetical protein
VSEKRREAALKNPEKAKRPDIPNLRHGIWSYLESAEVPQESADVAQEAEERRLRLYSDESMLE